MPVFGPSFSNVIDAAGLGLEPQEKAGGAVGGASQLHHLPELDAGARQRGKGRPSFSQASCLVSGDAKGGLTVHVCVCV